MARLARVIAVDMPHHVMQRGNRNQKVFFNDEDRNEYLRLLFEKSQMHHLEIWAYCLMDNHVHLIATPKQENSLAKSIGETHKFYTRMINFRENWRGYLWQGRFKSFVLDEVYLYMAVRYVERNPVRARIVTKAEEYFWSSARSHVYKTKNEILMPFYLLQEIQDWCKYLSEVEEKKELALLRRHGVTGRPLGTTEFFEKLKKRLGLNFDYKKPGPKIE